MNTLPKISIVTPSFNQGQFLRETIESVLEQNYLDLEYFIVDGGSTDNSVDIIREYKNHIDWWVSEKDEGQTDAIMRGFNRATGELFAWVNSDDVLFPGCLKAVADCYLKNGRPDLIHTNVAYIDSESRISRFIRVPCQSRFFFFRGVWHGAAPSIFYRTSLFGDVGGLNRKYYLSMDVDIWVRLMKTEARVAHIPRYLGGFRWHDSAKTVQSLKTRKAQENSETTEILNANLPRSNQSRRAFWRKVYNLYQVLNLNYLLAYKDLKGLGESRQWQEAVNTSPFSERQYKEE